MQSNFTARGACDRFAQLVDLASRITYRNSHKKGYTLTAMIRIFATIFAGVLGLAFGSFLNVCASRWPDDKSALKGRSRCDACERELSWWENVPLLSWIVLRGQCRTCKASIGWRHPFAELAVGGLWAITVWQFFCMNPTPKMTDITYTVNLANTVAEIIFEWLLVGLAIIDAENLWLPDKLILPGVVVSLVLNVVRGSLTASLLYQGGFDEWKHFAGTAAVNWFLSAVFSAAVVLVIRWAYIMVRGVEGLGMGDVKLMAMLGGWVGFKPAMLAFAIGVLACAAYAMYLLSTSPELRADKRTWAEKKLPLGAFISAGGIIAGLWGIPIVFAFSRWAGY